MNPSGITGSIPIAVQNSNPLIFTLPQDQTSVRPYWVVIGQIIVAQQVNRVVYRVVEGSWFTPWELGFICWIARIYIIIKDTRPRPPPTIITTSIPPPRPPIIAYFSPTYILKSLFLKNVNDNSKLSYHTQAEIEILDKIYKKYHKKIRFSIADSVDTLSLLANAIYYCVIQSSCMSAEDATIWNCYNIFGYKLYQNIFPNYFEFATAFLVKCMYGSKLSEILQEENLLQEQPNSSKKKSNSLRYYYRVLSYYFGLVSSTITFIFVSCLLLPFWLTNVIPMMFAYAFIYCIYWASVSIIIHFAGFFIHLSYKLEIPIILSSLLLSNVFLHTFPTLIITTYSYSQFLFYGNDYFQTMQDEYNTRDIPTFFKLLQNSDDFRYRTIINFF